MAHKVLLGPKTDLHLGVHNAFAKLLEPDFHFAKSECLHTFVMADEQHRSPFGFAHWGEFVDFGPGREIVHTARWPVVNRTAWTTDTDDFVYPIVCGRHFMSPDFRNAFRAEWSDPFRKNVLMRVRNMLTAYAHPSCKAVFYRSEFAARDAHKWLDKLGVEKLGDAYRSKIQVLYPVQGSCSADAMEAKWKKPGPMTVVFCGRDFESKNGRMALDIFDRLSSESTTHRFVYIGNVPEAQLRKYIQPPSSIVHHELLAHEQTLSLLRAAHVLFHPSKFEGLGTVFVEAAASGMAVITATGGAMRHVEELFDADGAMLVDRDRVGQSEEAFAFETHLRYLLKNPGVAKSMARNNFKLATVGKLSPERNRRVLLDVYERALRDPAAASLTFDDIPHTGGALLRLSSSQLIREEMSYRREAGVNEVRFLL